MLYAGLRAGCGYVLYCCYLHSTALNGAMDVVHSVIFPRGVVHRVENGWGLTKVAAVLLNALIW